MTDPREGTQPVGDPENTNRIEEQDSIEELDVQADDAENVKGGRRFSSDPCEGGEIAGR